MKNKWVFLSLGLSALAQQVSVPTANASDGLDQGPTELLVRYHSRAKSRSQSSDLKMLSLDHSIGEAEIVSEESGLTKVSLLPGESVEKAMERLGSMPGVEAVSVNEWYLPATRYTFRILTDEQIEMEANPKDWAKRVWQNFLRRLGLRAPGNMDASSAPVLDPTSPGDPRFPAVPSIAMARATQPSGIDPLIKADWAYQKVRLNLVARDQGIAPQTVAVIDTGVDYTHEDLRGIMWRKPTDEKIVGMDYATGTVKPYDFRHFDLEGCFKDSHCKNGILQERYLANPGHGTHCAGRVAAQGNNATGIRGVALGAKIMALKMFYDYGHPRAGQGDDAAAVKAIDFAIRNKVKIISASWGSKKFRATADKSELRRALLRARQAGILFVVAAGNDRLDQDTDFRPSYPAAYDLDNILVVAATDRNDKLASFSNYGAKSVDIAAPGVRIVSTIAGGGYSDLIARVNLPGTSSWVEVGWDGTSMATPQVAGAAALLWSKRPNATYLEIKNRILKTARKVPGLQGKVATGGVLDVASMLLN